MSRYQLADLVRYVGKDERWAGQQGRVTEVRDDVSVNLVVRLRAPESGRPVNICFDEASVELVEAASALPFEAAPVMELFEVYAQSGELRFVTSDRYALGTRRATDFVITRYWRAEGVAHVHSRPVED